MTVKERLHHLVDALPEADAHVAWRMLRGLKGRVEKESGADRPFYARLREMGIGVTPASPDARLPRAADVPGGDLSGAVVEEREEQL